MNIYPNPLLCLYCDAQIVPNTAVGCQKHLYRCPKHPVASILKLLEIISKKSHRAHVGWDTLWPEERKKALQDIEALAIQALSPDG